ncbi:MAG: cupin domain-containing protein [Endomicrobiales bacterium]|nr:cupin domain-containing protein [Endomicrobiales bacterium]
MEKFNEKEKSFRNDDAGPKYFVKGPHWEGGVLVFKPGQQLGEHWHHIVEETFYFLQGTPKMIVNVKEYRVEPGDVFKLSPEDKHNIVNDTDKPIKAVFIKRPFKPDDKATKK